MRHNPEEEQTGEYAHTPVMWREVLEYIRGITDCTGHMIVDCTMGEGGHTELFLEQFKDAKIAGFERDEEILEIAKGRLEKYQDRINFVNDNFKNIREHLGDEKGHIKSFLYDFGISSFHFDKSGRGFAFSKNEALDMRLDKNSRLDAFYVVNKYDEKRLTDIILKYGEERWAKRIAKVIVENRVKKPIETTTDLAEIVLRAIPRKFHVRNIHPATRVFQALRIEVNDELSSIERSLWDAAGLLARGGRIIAISFHSLEDRIVKNIFKRLSVGCTCNLDPRYCQCHSAPVVKILTKKPMLPEDDEVAMNKRSRSAKLRVCEKII